MICNFNIKNGNGLLSTSEDRKVFSLIKENQLYRIIKEEILPNPEIIRIKGEKALVRIKKYHNPKDNSEFLEGIYRDAIS